MRADAPSAAGGARGRAFLAVAVFALLGGYVVWPQVAAFGAIVAPGDTLAFVRAELASPLVRDAVRHSLLLSCWSVVLAAALGIGTAWLHERFRFPGRTLLLVGAVAPLTLPPIVGVMAFVRLVGFGGIVPRLLAAMTGESPARFVLADYPGILLIHAYSFSVYFFVLTRAGLASVDPAQELAARALGAGTWRRWRTAIAPVLLPFWASAALLTFMISMGSYSAPRYMTSGKPYLPVLTVEIAYHASAGEQRSAALLAAVLSLLCLGVLGGLVAGAGGAWRTARGGSKGSLAPAVGTTIRRPAARWAMGAAATLFAATMLLPPALVLLTSFADMRAWIASRALLPPELTLDNWRAILRPRGLHTHPILVSAYAAGLATAANLALGLASAWLIARGGRAVRAGIEIASMLPLALPGTVVAFQLVVAFGGPGSPWTLGVALRNTLWILVLAYVVRQIPLALRPLQASAARLDPLLERAARSLGAGAWRTFGSVVLPQLRGGLLAAGLICLVTGLGEFVASVLVQSTRWTPISIEIANALADSDGLGPAHAYAALLMLATTGVLVVYQRLTRAPA